jgi:thiol-disulfide isomerase/thioredoxin
MPELNGAIMWLNSPPLTRAQLKGKVVLVDFWTYSCINCVRTLPYITAWDAKYRDKGLVIIGVHSPEFEFEKKLDNVQAATVKYGIHYPVALDSDLATWSAFKNQYWPAHYLIDKNGQVVYTHFGEGDYDVTENNIRVLLGLGPEKAEAPMTTDQAAHADSGQTQETYLGYSRAKNFVGDATHDKAADYTFPNNLPLNNWALSGAWKIGAENITSEKPDAALRLNFAAKKVFLVLGAGGKPVHLRVMLNGKPVTAGAGADVKDGVVTVDRDALYELINQGESKNGLLEISADGPGLRAFAFTFGG